jgi:hypothetical protein
MRHPLENHWRPGRLVGQELDSRSCRLCRLRRPQLFRTARTATFPVRNHTRSFRTAQTAACVRSATPSFFSTC